MDERSFFMRMKKLFRFATDGPQRQQTMNETIFSPEIIRDTFLVKPLIPFLREWTLIDSWCVCSLWNLCQFQEQQSQLKNCPFCSGYRMETLFRLFRHFDANPLI